MKGFLNNSKGSVLILVTAGMVAFMGFAALAIDVGMLVVGKSRLQNAVDAAALAGAQELPHSTSQADSIARDYVSTNVLSGKIEDLYFSEGNRKITIRASNKVPFYFAKVFGMDEGEVEVKASAIKAPAGGMTGLRPFGVFEHKIDENPNITLREGAWDSEKGNFGTVGLAFEPNGGTTGANVLGKNIAYGSGETYYIGDIIETETGLNTQKVLENLNIEILKDGEGYITYYSGAENDYPNRVIVVPVIELASEKKNGTYPVRIIGFAGMFVEGVNQVGQGQGHIEVQGYFLEMIEGYEPDPSNPSYGIEAVKLVE